MIFLVAAGVVRALLFFRGLRTDPKLDRDKKGLNLWCNLLCVAGGVAVMIMYDTWCIKSLEAWNGQMPALRSFFFDGWMKFTTQWGPTLWLLGTSAILYIPCAPPAASSYCQLALPARTARQRPLDSPPWLSPRRRPTHCVRARALAQVLLD